MIYFLYKDTKISVTGNLVAVDIFLIKDRFKPDYLLIYIN